MLEQCSLFSPFIKEAVEDSALQAFAATGPGAGTGAFKWSGIHCSAVAVMIPHSLPRDGCCALEGMSLPAATKFPKQDWDPNAIIMWVRM